MKVIAILTLFFFTLAAQATPSLDRFVNPELPRNSFAWVMGDHLAPEIFWMTPSLYRLCAKQGKPEFRYMYEAKHGGFEQGERAPFVKISFSLCAELSQDYVDMALKYLRAENPNAELKVYFGEPIASNAYSRVWPTMSTSCPLGKSKCVCQKDAVIAGKANCSIVAKGEIAKKFLSALKTEKQIGIEALSTAEAIIYKGERISVAHSYRVLAAISLKQWPELFEIHEK